jgi:hypothetical protein
MRFRCFYALTSRTNKKSPASEPGHFVTREFKSHNNRSITQWNMCTGDGSVVGVGISYGEYNSEGQLTAMTGFFDPPEAG